MWLQNTGLSVSTQEEMSSIAASWKSHMSNFLINLQNNKTASDIDVGLTAVSLIEV